MNQTKSKLIGDFFWYVDGLHVNHTYTTMAQLLLTKQMMKTDKWRMVSDDDMVLKAATKKAFSKEEHSLNNCAFLLKYTKITAKLGANSCT
ncbi:hypothetical protein [Bacillus sp. AFS017274]|uniref:hypothetical protein n=1 Tax=Bacillaceae TaxID=186817 RepID=UPI000BF58C9C|nr:hypothetical protein [Bacillus sp. AFS017274]PEZ74198.1 hypothetical protein CN380_24460 [Bacillus sp. AFS017274]